MISMNKRAQLGKLIISFPIILAVFVIMGIFIFISATASIIKGSESDPMKIGTIPGDDLMTKSIIVDLDGNGQAERMLVVDAVAQYLEKGYERGDKQHAEMRNSSGNLMSDGDLLFIFKSNSRDKIDVRYAEFYLFKSEDELFDETAQPGGEDVFDIYYKAGRIRTITLITEKGTFYIHYYLGKRDISGGTA